ncbi:MAG TPA: helix-turn-helix domain-containing protein [Candidatus Eisenbacteria bacterium]|nr:helix-turn-helix domain-containing protein [Candidatus Eisenbacteria bacterium]
MTTSLEVVRRADHAAVLMDPVRQRLLAHLAEPDSASGLARKLRLPRQRLNYHLRALERIGLVELVEERRKGNCVERILRASARAFLISPEALGVIGLPADEPADRWSAAYLIASAGRAIREVASLQARARREKKSIATFTVDGEIRFRSAETRAAFAQELSNAVARLTAKYHDEKAPGGRGFRFLAAIHPTPKQEPRDERDHD